MKMKPCPFCGSNNVEYCDCANVHQCKKCLACGPCTSNDSTSDHDDSLKDWNTRASQWQPIETAPKDEYILVYPPTYTGLCSCAKWFNDDCCKKPRPYFKRTDSLGIYDSRSKPPTHWQPLPETPK